MLENTTESVAIARMSIPIPGRQRAETDFIVSGEQFLSAISGERDYRDRVSGAGLSRAVAIRAKADTATDQRHDRAVGDVPDRMIAGEIKLKIDANEFGVTEALMEDLQTVTRNRSAN